jgi:hypothetical protein
MKAGLAGLLTLALAGLSSVGPAQEPTTGEWRSFSGTWSVSGRRVAVAIEDGGTAAIVEVSGAVMLTTGEGLSRGFRGQAIGFEEGQGLGSGRSVWTDENGDRVFSRLKGDSLGTGKRFVGTITGGTGRYAGLEGEYAFTWQYVVSGEGGAGVVQGRTADLAGRVRRTGESR